jgi:hypothetical protein
MAHLTLAQFKAYYRIPGVRFTGAGLNDITVGGIDANTPQASYVVYVDGTGATDTFKWSNDGGTTWEATTVNMATTAVTLENNVTVLWPAKTGHTSGNYWSFTVENLRRDSVMSTCIADAQSEIESKTGRVFEWTGDGTARYFDYRSPRPVYGRELHFDMDTYSITSVVNGDGDTIDSDEYVTIPRNETPYRGIVLLSSTGLSWTYEDDIENAITVTAKWAYSASAPTRIVEITRMLAKHFLDLREGKLQIAGADAGAVPPIQYWPWDVRQGIRAYTRMWGFR